MTKEQLGSIPRRVRRRRRSRRRVRPGRRKYPLVPSAALGRGRSVERLVYLVQMTAHPASTPAGQHHHAGLQPRKPLWWPALQSLDIPASNKAVDPFDAQRLTCQRTWLSTSITHFWHRLVTFTGGSRCVAAASAATDAPPMHGTFSTYLKASHYLRRQVQRSL
jgi:hypothetical protein